MASLLAGLAGCEAGPTAKGGAPGSPASPASTQPVNQSPASSSSASAQTSAPAPASDVVPTSAGDLRITPVHHGTLVLEHGGKVIHIDPFSEGKLDALPKADLILITDIHFDHLDKAAIEKVKKAGTVIVGPQAVAAELSGVEVIKNGESKPFAGVPVEAIPMYNLKRGPSEGKLFHDKGRGNGYILTFGDKKVYISGDTECIDEMRALKGIEVAFVCMNLPYTMPPSEAAECIKAFRPKVVYPYHFRGSKLEELSGALANEKDIEVRIRSWY